MLNKFIKQGGRKVPKSDAIEPSSIVNLTSRPQNSTPIPTHNSNPNSAKIEALPLFRDVSPADRNVIFLRKLQICSVVFDLTDSLKFAREKETKRQTLLELVDFIQSGNNRIDETAQEELVKSIFVNVFRCLPPPSHRSEISDPEEEDDL